MLAPEAVVVNKSTVPVGSTRVVEQALGRGDVFVVSNPEFLREGSAVHDFLHPDRVVIGAEDQAAAVRVASLYLGVAAPLMVTDPASAETIKYASQRVPGHEDQLRQRHRRGVRGGRRRRQRRRARHGLRQAASATSSCDPARAGAAVAFPKDTRALVRIAEDAGYDFGLLRGVIAVNEEQFERVARRSWRWSAARSTARRSRVWGLTFKARTDDLRESPALAIIDRLVRAGRRGAGVRPDGRRSPFDRQQARPARGIEVVADPYAACEGAEVLLVLTEWDEFKWLDFDKVAELMAHRASSTPATCSTARRCAGAASQYTGIGRSS